MTNPAPHHPGAAGKLATTVPLQTSLVTPQKLAQVPRAVKLRPFLLTIAVVAVFLPASVAFSFAAGDMGPFGALMTYIVFLILAFLGGAIAYALLRMRSCFSPNESAALALVSLVLAPIVAMLVTGNSHASMLPIVMVYCLVNLPGVLACRGASLMKREQGPLGAQAQGGSATVGGTP